MLTLNFMQKYEPMHGVKTKACKGYREESFQNVDKKKITFIQMGEYHTDPAPHGLTRHYIEKFHKLAIDQIRCEEQPYDITFEEDRDINDFWKEPTKKWLEVDAIRDIAIHDEHLSFPYFLPLHEEKIKQVLARLRPDFNPENCEQLKNALCRHLHTKELSLLDEQHLRLNIPYQAIDISKNEHCEQLYQVATSDDPDYVFKYEEIRINTMVHNIFTKCVPQIEERGGIIWINHGASHLLNLSSAIFNHIIENRLYQNHTFKIVPTYCSSPYNHDSVDSLLLYMEKSQQHLTNQKIIEISKKMSISFFEVTETGKHNYTSDAFDELMQNIAKNHGVNIRE